jgi:hypothetical protein
MEKHILIVCADYRGVGIERVKSLETTQRLVLNVFQNFYEIKIHYKSSVAR